MSGVDGLLPVEQQDREAAADCAHLMKSQAFNGLYCVRGDFDNHPLVQRFACHRLAAQENTDENQ